MEDLRHTSTPNTMVGQVRTAYRRVAHYVQLAVVGRTPPPALPILHDRTMATRRRDVTQGLMYLPLWGIICVMYHVAWSTAAQFSVAIAVLVLTYLVHAMYLCIYGMEDGGIISREYSDELARRVEEMSFVGNMFVPNSTFWRLLGRLREGLAGFGRDELG